MRLMLNTARAQAQAIDAARICKGIPLGPWELEELWELWELWLSSVRSDGALFASHGVDGKQGR